MIKLINAWSPTYDRGEVSAGDIILLFNDEKGRRVEHIKNPSWYFFVDKNENVKSFLTGYKGPISGWKEGKNYIKIEMEKKIYKDPKVSQVVADLEEAGIKTYEADVGPAKRYIIDHKIEIEDYSKINVLFFDIETDDSTGRIEYEEYNGMQSIKAKDRILSFAAIDKNGKEYFIHNEDEKVLLEEVNKLLNDVDMLVGWNSKEFDIPYLWKRMQFHKMNNMYMKNILHEDMMKRVQYFYSKDPEARQNLTSYSLDSISKYFLKEGKIERSGKVFDLMKEDFGTFKEYNLTDCRLLKKLEDKLGLINLTYQMFQMCGVTAQNWSMVKALDNLILKEANNQGIHYPTNESYLKEYEPDTEQEEYLGAFVLDPEPGYYENVYDLDFKSLYPNIIRTFNISPETLEEIRGIEGIETPGVEIDGEIKGKCTYSFTKGIIPQKIEILLDEREKIRKEQKKHTKDSIEWRDLNVKQLVVKELANSIYGIIGNKYFRGFNVDIAESITGTGQFLIKFLKRTFEAKGRRVIYGDTDSVFVILADGEKVENVLDETNKDIASHLRKKYKVQECTIQLDLDKIFDKFLILSKKKYAGSAEGKTRYTGLECIKRDNIPAATRAQKALIEKVFKKDPDLEEWIGEWKKHILTGNIPPEDITIYKKLQKDAYTYKGKTAKKYTPPIQVRIAKSLKENKGDKTDLTKAGSIIGYIVTQGSPMEGVHVSEYKGEWDRNYYWDCVIYPQLERILEAVEPNKGWDKFYTYWKNETDTKSIKRRVKQRSLLQEVCEEE